MTELPPVPGKLMLAGEYAVLRPSGTALAVAVAQVVQTSLRPGPGQITMHAFDQTFSLSPGQHAAPGLLGFAARALAWLQNHHAISMKQDATMQVAGAVGGAKVGLGTSAAVTVAALRAALMSNGLNWTPAQVADAARQIHGAGQGAGSGYDVTTIAYGGCIAYRRSPDRAEPLAWPRGLHGLALFSGAPAPTQAALDKPPIAQRHLDAIDTAARHLLAAWQGPTAGILTALSACDAAFVAAAVDDLELIPAHVQQLRAAIARHGCVVRASGAGGGDCVLAFADNAAAITALANAWQTAGGHLVARLPADIAPEAA